MHKRTYSTCKRERPRPSPPPHFAFMMYPLGSVIYHPTNKGVQGRPPACKHARAIVCAQSCVLSRSSSFAFNMHRAGGQRALLCIRSASSNSKRHQSASTPPFCRRHPPSNNETKSTMKAGNERWQEQTDAGSALLCSASHSYSSLSAVATGGSQDLVFYLWRRCFFVFSGSAWLCLAVLHRDSASLLTSLALL